MKVYFFPPTSPFNPYIDNIISGLEYNGNEIVNIKAQNKWQKFVSSFDAMIKHTDIYHFNWIENNSAVGTIKNRIICQMIFIWLKMMKMSGGKIVWTMHNRESHFCKEDKKFHYQFMKKFISRLDLIVVHARETELSLIQEYNFPKSKICYVPHGNYISANSKNIYETEKHKEFIFLIFGMVNRYKNIPLFIEVFKELDLPNAELKIYGKCDENDVELLDEINKQIGMDKRIEYQNRFIPDNEVDKIFAQSDLVVLPYDKQSMINSGAAIKAFSEGKPIIVSRFGAIKDIEEYDFVHSYDYTSLGEHKVNLKKLIKMIYNQWLENKDCFKLEGQNAYRYAVEELSWNKICKTISLYYEKAVRGL